VLTSAAVGVAVISLACLAVVLAAAAAGLELWSGFMTVALYGLPVAFLLLAALIIANVILRRRA
jgi:hypothetical protein